MLFGPSVADIKTSCRAVFSSIVDVVTYVKIMIFIFNSSITYGEETVIGFTMLVYLAGSFKCNKTARLLYMSFLALT